MRERSTGCSTWRLTSSSTIARVAFSMTWIVVPTSMQPAMARPSISGIGTHGWSPSSKRVRIAGISALNFYPLARAALAHELLGSVSPALSVVHFANGGSEANEAAIKAARIATGREKIVSIRGGRHGVMGLAGELSGGALLTPSAHAAASVVQVGWDDLGAIEAAVRPKDVAAVIIEPIPAELGLLM